MNKLVKISVLLLGVLGLGAAGSAHAAAYAYSSLDIYNFGMSFAFTGTPSVVVSSQTASTYTDALGNNIYAPESRSSLGGDVLQSFSGAPTRATENFGGPLPSDLLGQWALNATTSPVFGRADANLDTGVARSWGKTVAETLANGPVKHTYATGQSVNSMTVQFVGGGVGQNQALNVQFDAQALMQVWLDNKAQSGSFANAATEFSVTLSEYQWNGVFWQWVTIDSIAPSALNQTISQLDTGGQSFLPSGSPFSGFFNWTSLNIDQGDTYKIAVTMKSSADAYNIPEPATAFLAGLGLLGVLASRRRGK